MSSQTTKVFQTGIKDLKISLPSKAQTYTELRCNVILVAKYDFEAESKHELSVKKGVVVKLLNRMKNGWVLVQLLDEVKPPGLVPSSYVDIAVNDPRHPITLQWLRSMDETAGGKSKTFMDVEVRTLLENNTPVTFNNKPYPLSASVAHYLTFEDRFWYRVDVDYSTGEHGYLCRYYQDFYDLHVHLLENFTSVDIGESEESVKLPKLPEPVPSLSCSSEDAEVFLRRCKQLSSYMNDLISNKHYQTCFALVEWLEADYKGLPGIVTPQLINDSTEAINQKILPGSVTLASKTKPPATPRSDPTPKPSPAEQSEYGIPSAPSGPQRTRTQSKNIYNHYRQILNYSPDAASLQRSSTTKEVTRNGLINVGKRNVSGGLLRARTVQVATTATNAPSTPKVGGESPGQNLLGHSKFSTPPNVHGDMSSQEPYAPPKFSSSPSLKGGSPGSQMHPKFSTPKIGGESPLFAPFTPSQNDTWIKCQVKTQRGDVISIRVEKKSFTTIEDFKKVIYSKVAFNNLFIKLPHSESFEEIESPETDSLNFLNSSSKVLLLLT